jgi:hypothetical protein
MARFHVARPPQRGANIAEAQPFFQIACLPLFSLKRAKYVAANIDLSLS